MKRAVAFIAVGILVTAWLVVIEDHVPPRIP